VALSLLQKLDSLDLVEEDQAETAKKSSALAGLMASKTKNQAELLLTKTYFLNSSFS
jgi:hypothetical protein